MNDPLVPVALLQELARTYIPPALLRHPRRQPRPVPAPRAGAATTCSGEGARGGAGGSAPRAGQRRPAQVSAQPGGAAGIPRPCAALRRRFPPTFILSGGLDPLLDDAVDFSTRLRRLGVAGELQVRAPPPLDDGGGGGRGGSARTHARARTPGLLLLLLQVLRSLPHGFLNFKFLPGVHAAVATLRLWVTSVLGVCAA